MVVANSVIDTNPADDHERSTQCDCSLNDVIRSRDVISYVMLRHVMR